MREDQTDDLVRRRKCRPRAYGVIVIVWGLVLMVPMVGFGQAIYSSSPQVQRVFVSSGKLRKVFDEVKSYGYVNVVVTQDLSTTDAFGGTSNPQSTPGGMVYDVHVSPGSDVYVENLIAHELFHASLRHEHFYSGPTAKIRGQDLSASDLMAMEDLVGSLGNCYHDALIDRRMAKLGFNPQLLQDDAKSTLIAQAKLIPHTALYKQHSALIMYCLSIRLRNFKMDKIYAAHESWYPELSRDVETITRAVGPELCDTGETCFKKMLALRKAVGLQGEVWFPNPLTNKIE